jgi:hypothetical protein
MRGENACWAQARTVRRRDDYGDRWMPEDEENDRWAPEAEAADGPQAARAATAESKHGKVNNGLASERDAPPRQPAKPATMPSRSVGTNMGGRKVVDEAPPSRAAPLEKQQRGRSDARLGLVALRRRAVPVSEELGSVLSLLHLVCLLASVFVDSLLWVPSLGSTFVLFLMAKKDDVPSCSSPGVRLWHRLHNAFADAWTKMSLDFGVVFVNVPYSPCT